MNANPSKLVAGAIATALTGAVIAFVALTREPVAAPVVRPPSPPQPSPLLLAVSPGDIVTVDPGALPMIAPPADALQVVSFNVRADRVSNATIEGPVLSVIYTVPASPAVPNQVRHVTATYDSPMAAVGIPRTLVRSVGQRMT
jgi:hypothetical protein